MLKPALGGRLCADGRIEWQAAQGEQARVLKVVDTRIDLNELQLGPTRQPLASLERLEVKDLHVNLTRRSVKVGDLTLTQPRLRVQREADGGWMFEPWLVPAQAPGATPWRVDLAALQLNGGSVGFVDRLPARSVTLHITRLQLAPKGLRPLASDQKDMAMSIQARVSGGPTSRMRLDRSRSLASCGCLRPGLSEARVCGWTHGPSSNACPSMHWSRVLRTDSTSNACAPTPAAAA